MGQTQTTEQEATLIQEKLVNEPENSLRPWRNSRDPNDNFVAVRQETSGSGRSMHLAMSCLGLVDKWVVF